MAVSVVGDVCSLWERRVVTNQQGKKLWSRSTRAIPGGNGLLSKRPDRYAPDVWPNYFSAASGVEVQDLDGNSFIDMAQMGIGSAILGYANPELTESVETIIFYLAD